MRCSCQVHLLLVCAIGWSSGLHGQQTPGFRALDDALVTMMREDSVVGGAAVLVRDGRVVAHAEHGWSDRGAAVRLGPEAVFHWGSITKTLTAVAIMQLRDRGKLSLDDPITRWVPELRQVHNPYGSMDAITLRMLLSHASGFQNPTWPYRQYVAWEPFEPTRWEQLVSMMPYQQILFPPGSRFSYSNPAFIYLARVIESITGDPYQSYVYKNIWLPLGMRRSYFGATPYNLAPFRSNNYTLVRDSTGMLRMEDNGREFDPGITIPNGGWNAPMSDLAIWVSFLNGSSSNDTVLSRKSLEEMWVPQVSAGEAGGGSQSMGLSFFLLDRGETKLVGHTGEQAGFRSLAFFDPVRHAGVIVCLNTTNEAQPDSSGRAFDRVLAAAVRVLAP